MIWQLKLSREQHTEIWKRKMAIESKFQVTIFSPYYEGKSHRISPGSASKQDDLFDVQVAGDQCKLQALKTYVDDAFLHPGAVSAFCFEEDLKPILGNKLWVEVLEDLYSVCITTQRESLSVTGTFSAVSSAMAAMTELSTKYNEWTGKFSLEDGLNSAEELVLALRVCKNLEVDVQTFKSFPKGVITLLMSWLKQAYKENFPLNDTDANSLDNSIVILDVPDKKNNIPVIVLDSDEEYELSVEELDENSPPMISTKRKKQTKPKSKKRQKPLVELKENFTTVTLQ